MLFTTCNLCFQHDLIVFQRLKQYLISLDSSYSFSSYLLLYIHLLQPRQSYQFILILILHEGYDVGLHHLCILLDMLFQMTDVLAAVRLFLIFKLLSSNYSFLFFPFHVKLILLYFFQLFVVIVLIKFFTFGKFLENIIQDSIFLFFSGK